MSVFEAVSEGRVILLKRARDILSRVAESGSEGVRRDMITAMRVLRSPEMRSLFERDSLHRCTLWNVLSDIENGLTRDDLKAVRDFALFAKHGLNEMLKDLGTEA